MPGPDAPARPTTPDRTRPGPASPDVEALVRIVAAGGALAPRRALLAAHGMDPGAACRAGPRAWRQCGLDPEQRRALAHPDAAPLARALRWLEAPGHHVLGWGTADYPPLLAASVRPPIALFVAGDPLRLWQPLVAVVGTRNPTPGGRDHAAGFSRAFVAAGLGVASGLAAGIDTAAHQAVLEAGGTTVAVLGTGPDIAYPARNRPLLARIAADGAVASEYLPGTRANQAHFPARNRIIAGLALGTLVVEAAWRSGALITARLAADAGREVMALPGSIANPMARGCHRLIRDGAALVEAPAEVLDQLAPAAAVLGQALQARLAASGSGPGCDPSPPPADPGPLAAMSGADPQRLWRALGHDPTDMDALVMRTGLTAADVSSMLLAMELEGRVVNDHGRYSRNPVRVATRKAS